MDFEQLFEILKTVKEILEVFVLVMSSRKCFKEARQEYPEFKEYVAQKYHHIKEKNPRLLQTRLNEISNN